jgi:predicted small lipoprotein YifL
MIRRLLLPALLAACALLTGCGQKGPLFIPPEPPAAADTPGDGN